MTSTEAGARHHACRDIIAAIHEAASAAPPGTGGKGREMDRRRARDLLYAIRHVTGPGGWTLPGAGERAAAFLRAEAARPLGYTPVQDPAHHGAYAWDRESRT